MMGPDDMLLIIAWTIGGGIVCAVVMQWLGK